MPTITKNKQALYNYEIIEKYEAGIMLAGHEVKSVKNGQINLKGSYVTIGVDPKSQKPALFLMKANISLYKHAGSMPNYDPERPRKLLIHKKELNSLIGKTKEKGLTIIPISVYTKGNLVKIEFALAKGKKLHDKREQIMKRDIERDIGRKLKS